MHKFLVCAHKSQDFAHSQKQFVRSHNLETMTFRNSGSARVGSGVAVSTIFVLEMVLKMVLRTMFYFDSVFR